jgi:hypothetical protein
VPSPIAEARAMFERGAPWWPAPLLRSLMEQAERLGYEWVASCTRKLLPVLHTDKREQLLADLEAFEQLRAHPVPSDEFRQRAEAIWYRSGRDAAQTAVSRLCWALACEVCPDMEAPEVELRRALVCLVSCPPRPHENFELCLSEYSRLLQQEPASPS